MQVCYTVGYIKNSLSPKQLRKNGQILRFVKNLIKTVNFQHVSILS